MSNTPTHAIGADPDVLEHIAKALSNLRYGSVEITVHDSRVVQIDRTEKLRLSQDSNR